VPSARSSHHDAILTNMSIAYMQSSADFIATKVFPAVPVQKQSDRYIVYPKAAWFRDEAEKRAPGAVAKEVKFDVDNTPTYFCEEWALSATIADEERENADSPLSPDQDLTEFLTQKMLLRRERLWTERYFKTGVWGLDLEGVAGTPSANQFKQWDQAAVNPFQHIKELKLKMKETTGMEPNTLVIGPYVYNVLSEHPEALDRIKYTQKGIITAEILASLFDIQRVLVGKATVNLGEEGAQDAFGFIHGKNGLLCYAEPNPGLRKPSAGYTFAWRGLNPGFDQAGIVISRGRIAEDRAHADYVEARMAFDQKVVSADLGIFLESLVG
jgi:hypothetical protein